jgi:hypothetical protein
MERARPISLRRDNICDALVKSFENQGAARVSAFLGRPF